VIKVYLLLLVLGFIGGAGYGAYYYYKDTQARIQILTENSAKLEAAHETQSNTIKTLKEDGSWHKITTSKHLQRQAHQQIA